MFREVSHLLLPGAVDHENCRLASIVAEVGRVPPELELNVEQEVVFVGIGNTVSAQHRALVDDKMGGGGGALTRLKGPLNAHGVTSLVAGKHHFDRGQIRTPVGFTDFDVEFVGLTGVQPCLSSPVPRESIGCQFRGAVNGELVHEQVLTLLCGTTVLDGVARRVGAVQIHGHLLTEAARRVVDHQGVNAG